jgi:hypothetical protein
MSRRGQFLGFVAILVLLAIMFFVFRYHQDTFDFTVATGSTQAHLVTGFVETEKAKVYAQNSLRQSAMESMWDLSGETCDTQMPCSSREEFLASTDASFNKYISMYESNSDIITTLFPGYSLEASCFEGRTRVEAFGFNEECFLRDGYPYPRIPCEDQEGQEACNSVAYVDGRPNACIWNSANEECSEATPAPICEISETREECESTTDCTWSTSYAEQIDAISAPLQEYQFRASANGHFVEDITCAEYAAFVESRKNLG